MRRGARRSLVLLTCGGDERFWCEGEQDGVWLRRVTWMANRVGAKASLPLEEKKDWDGVVVNL